MIEKIAMSVKPVKSAVDKQPASECKRSTVAEGWDGGSGEPSVANPEHLP